MVYETITFLNDCSQCYSILTWQFPCEMQPAIVKHVVEFIPQQVSMPELQTELSIVHLREQVLLDSAQYKSSLICQKVL